MSFSMSYLKLIAFFAAFYLTTVTLAQNATDPNEITALNTFYHENGGQYWRWGLQPGVEWFSSSNYSDPCLDNWQGITCDQSYYPVGSNYSHITTIQLNSYNVTGTFPTCLQNITYLDTLSLKGNDIVGPLPNITLLRNLYSLDLSLNSLTGSLGSFLGDMLSLAYLYLESNELTGTLPTSLFRLPKLANFYISSNFINGSIPQELFSQSSLKTANLQNNLLTGTLPAYILMPNLKNFGVSSNQLHGALPEFDPICPLYYIYMSHNNFTGTIPPSYSNLTGLDSLYLDHNDLTGPIPDLHKIKYLKELSLQYNRLEGPIPDLSTLHSMDVFDLSHNGLTGTLPASLANMTYVSYLNLGSNALNGPIPSQIAHLGYLNYLHLDHNQLTGELPANINLQVSLLTLDVQYNRLSGTLPFITNMGNLNEIYLNSNLFNGPLPDSLGRLSFLKKFYADHNRFEGTLPSTLNVLYNLEAFSVCSNKLTGSIPSNLFSTSNKLVTVSVGNNQFTDMSQNNLVGTIPASISNLINVEVLNFSFNALEQTLPAQALQGLQRLQVFLAQSNQLTGDLSSATPFMGLNNLKVVDLSSNGLTGTVPGDLFTQMPALEVLSLSDNCFHGELPTQDICATAPVSNLSILSLSGLSTPLCHQKAPSTKGATDHFMQGGVPSCLFQMPNLSTLQLSGNGFTGELSMPALEGIRTSFLSTLELSHNQLSGTLPGELVQYPTLNNLDLSFNRIEGPIDNRIDTQFFLSEDTGSFLSLENNRLSGRIDSSFHDLPNIKLLLGNMFSCQQFHSHAPSQDPSYKSYICGSNSLNVSLFTMIAVVLVVLLYFLVVHYLHPTQSMKLMFDRLRFLRGILARPSSLSSNPYRSSVVFFHSLSYTRFLFVFPTVLAIAVYLMLYLSIQLSPSGEDRPSIYQDIYLWATSSAYLSSTHLSFLFMVLWLTTFILELLFLYVLHWIHDASSESPASEDSIPPTLQPFFEFIQLKYFDMSPGKEKAHVSSPSFDSSQMSSMAAYQQSPSSPPTSGFVTRENIFFGLVCSFFVVLSFVCNMLYVLMMDKSAFHQGAKLFFQFLLGLFKFLWSSVAVSTFLNSYNRFTPSSAWVYSTFLLMENLLIPMVVTLLFGTSCFNYYFTGMPSQSTYLPYEVCLTDGALTNCISSTINFDFRPAFIYYFACSSSFIALFVPVYLYKFMISILMYPLGMSFFATCSLNYLPVFVMNMIPRVFRPQDQKRIQFHYLINPFTVLMDLVKDLVVVMTLGLTTPLLALAGCLSICVASFSWQFIIVRFLYYDHPTSDVSNPFFSNDAYQEKILGQSQQNSNSLRIEDLSSSPSHDATNNNNNTPPYEFQHTPSHVSTQNPLVGVSSDTGKKIAASSFDDSSYSEAAHAYDSNAKKSIELHQIQVAPTVPLTADPNHLTGVDPYGLKELDSYCETTLFRRQRGLFISLWVIVLLFFLIHVFDISEGKSDSPAMDQIWVLIVYPVLMVLGSILIFFRY